MAGVAVHGSHITQVIKPNHISYTIQSWQIVSYSCTGGWIEDVCQGWTPNYAWVTTGSGNTHAKISGTVSAPSSKIEINGDNVAVQGDATIETWVADPPVPSDTGSTRYININPGTSGSGQGYISSGSVKGKLGTAPIALVGSQVTTHLGTVTTIANGNEQLSFSS